MVLRIRGRKNGGGRRRGGGDEDGARRGRGVGPCQAAERRQRVATPWHDRATSSKAVMITAFDRDLPWSLINSVFKVL